MTDNLMTLVQSRFGVNGKFSVAPIQLIIYDPRQEAPPPHSYATSTMADSSLDSLTMASTTDGTFMERMTMEA